MALTDRQKRFIVEYPIDSNGTQAAIRAGYSVDGASQMAVACLSNPEIMEAIIERQTEIARAASLSVEWVLNQWRELVIADPNDLIWVEIESCRHCHGVAHQYQWTQFEYDDVVRRCAEHQCGSKCEQPCVKRIPPLALGGFGFNPHRAPHEACPACHGNGVEQVRLADTRRLRGPARRLYAGIKKTKDGIEIKMRDQDKALDNIAKFLGMVVDKREMSGPGGGPIATVNFTAEDLTDDQLVQFIAQERERIKVS